MVAGVLHPNSPAEIIGADEVADFVLLVQRPPWETEAMQEAVADALVERELAGMDDGLAELLG